MQLTKALAAQLEEKCHLIDKYSARREQCAGIESSLDDAMPERESLNIPNTYRRVTVTYWILRQEITLLVHKLKEERSKCSRQEEGMAEMLKMLKSLGEMMKIPTSQAASPNLPGCLKPSPNGPLTSSGHGS